MKTKMKRKYTAVEKRENRQLYLLMLPVFILIAVFCYAPMFGIVIAFQDYWPGDPFFGDGAMWVGLDNFKRFVQGEYFGRLIKNTLVLSGLNLIFGFTMPIIFALLLDQIKHLRFKKFCQTASYMPYFISTVVVAGMVISFIDVNGLITKLLTIVGLPNINWRQEPSAFPTIYTFTNVWKLFGFNSILYMSTISSIDQGLYEAAKIDGANRWQQCWHVTLSGIKPIIAINLIMQVGSILSTNSDLILLLYTPATYDARCYRYVYIPYGYFKW
ncbi:MAG: ABC transporter permease [Lachnospiraceae bacterium]